MIWTDSDFITVADLSSVDPDIVDTATSLDLILTGDNGIIRRGVEAAGMRLENILVSFTTYLSSNDLSANHLSAVFYTGSAPNQRRRVTLDQIVVSGRNASYWSELKEWVVNEILTRFYISAANKAENDRYETKRNEFRAQGTLTFMPQLRKSGVPIVYRPMPAPAATQYRRPGSWTAGQAVQAGATAVGQYDVTITYVDQGRYIDQINFANAESGPAVLQTVTLTSGNSITLDITNLTPPNGAVPMESLARGFVVPLNATGWNIYVGLHDQTQYLQNANPVMIASKTFQLPGDPVLSGYAVGIGQYPEAFLTTQDLIQRG